MVALLRSTDGNPDSRYEKYVEFINRKNLEFISICWDRSGNKKDSDNYLYYHKPANYGDGSANIKKLIGFNKFLFITLKNNRSRYSVIHAADFDTIIPAILMKLFYRKRVIYDIYDWYIDSRCIKSVLLKYLILAIEFICIKLADKVIICEPEREKQIVFKPKDLWILPNIPNYEEDLLCQTSNSGLIISYVGILGEERGLHNVVRLAKENPSVFLEIAGFGPLVTLLDDVYKYSNIQYHGKVKYVDALSIMSRSDLIYAMYETTNPNHILAAPNKYYEGLYLGKPIITTKGTIVGDKTEKYKTGYVIGEKYADLCNLVENLDKDGINQISNNARLLWQRRYKSYVQNFMDNIYLPYIIGTK